jgi:hypothetical protein
MKSSPLAIYYSSPIVLRFCLLSGCKFSTKRSGVGNVRLADGAPSSVERVVNQALGGGGELRDEAWVVRLECGEGALFEDLF